MSKQRYIKDSFWTDPYIEKLSPDYKLVFLYLLTNPLANISGVFEIRIKRVAFETGYDVEVIENILNKFVEDKKIIQHESWIVIVNHIKHQSLGNDTAKGISREIMQAPKEIVSLFEEKTLVNTKGEPYSVLVLKENNDLFIDPLETPPFGAYSLVKLSKVKLSKNTHGEFENVLLSEDEYNKLVEKLGKQETDILIEQLSGYMKSKGKKYSSHYATILNWDRRKKEEKQSKSKTLSSYKK